ncbi:hypothetical protein OQA88_7797 [Cercophora sp. LCS_1]
MSSYGSRRRPLDATSGREVVYCYGCAHEWYRDERESLQCPRCRNEVTEIIDPANDIRNELPPPPSPGTFGFGQRRRDNSDSDPEEDDIENHMRHSPLFSHQGSRDAETLRRFADMLRTDRGPPHGSRPSSRFPPSPGGEHDPFSTLLFPPGSRLQEGGTSGYSRTWRTDNGTTSFTFYSTTIPGGAEGASAFPRLLSQIMSNGAPPNLDDPNRAGAGGDRPVPGFRLHDFLAALIPGPGNGDAVRTQEELDRIITALMEANPQSNAAPPASQGAIESLAKKRIDETMLGPEGKAECTICIDELHKGDEVTVLPCTHWFHGECVTLWLREHNTCPICRASIDGDQSQGNNNNRSYNQSRPQPEQSTQPTSSDQPPSFASFFNPPRSTPQRPVRSQRENTARLEAIRTAAGFRTEPYTTLPRRNSLSPVSPSNYGEGSSRTRVRSPSIGQDQDSGVSPYDRDRNRNDSYSNLTFSQGQDNRETRESDSRSTQTGGHGAINWLRDHFGRGFGGSDRRRPP